MFEKSRKRKRDRERSEQEKQYYSRFGFEKSSEDAIFFPSEPMAIDDVVNGIVKMYAEQDREPYDLLHWNALTCLSHEVFRGEPYKSHREAALWFNLLVQWDQIADFGAARVDSPKHLKRINEQLDKCRRLREGYYRSWWIEGMKEMGHTLRTTAKSSEGVMYAPQPRYPAGADADKHRRGRIVVD